MQWTKPDFQEITLGMEVTGYVNIDDRLQPTTDPQRAEPRERSDAHVACVDTSFHFSNEGVGGGCFRGNLCCANYRRYADNA